MTIKLNDFGGGGGIFRAETFIHDQTITSGQTGDLVTIGTAGKVTKLISLSSASSSVSQPDITITSDGANIITAESISDTTPTAGSGVYISEGLGSSNVNNAKSSLSDVTGEFITISKGAGNTVQDLDYSYITGVIS